MDDLNEKIAILCHGFNKSHNDMYFLSAGLKKRGINNIAVNLPLTFRSFDDCVDSFHAQIHDTVKTFKTVNFVGHSMGGLIIRSYINNYGPENIKRCVFIATPHRGSDIAKIAGNLPFYRSIVKPIHALQPSRENNYLLANKAIEIGLIAGSKNNALFGKLFLSRESDGRVDVRSASSADAKDMRVLPYGHKEIHHKEEVLNLTVNFLENGIF
ncbi:MAG: alpha/beta fold hydrolase [Treponema sp.]|nr:alpha/beta fold hydrolase [Treponema sp.]